MVQRLEVVRWLPIHVAIHDYWLSIFAIFWHRALEVAELLHHRDLMLWAMICSLEFPPIHLTRYQVVAP